MVKDDSEVFVVADLNKVWINLQIHQKDISLISKGQEVIFSAKSSVPRTRGVIDYVEPVINAKTRRSLARVVMENTSGVLRPGKFITADVLVTKRKAELVVGKSIIQDIDDKSCVFVQNEHGFEARPVTIGWSNDKYAEVISGLSVGEKIVIRNSFRIKAELEKEAGGGHAGHGHVH